MSISLATAMEIKDALLDRMDRVEAIQLLMKLRQIDGNQSYRDSIDLTIHVIEESEDI